MKTVTTHLSGSVAARRAADEQFPKIVPAVETGSLGGTLSWGSQGSADAFKDVPANKLLARLQSLPSDPTQTSKWLSTVSYALVYNILIRGRQSFVLIFLLGDRGVATRIRVHG
jgi:hypothetical protein